MKKNQIKSFPRDEMGNVNATQMYKNLKCVSLIDTCQEEAKLGEFVNISRSIIREAIDDICRANRRTNEMSEDDRKSLVERIYARKPHYTFEDIKMFAEMLIAGELLTGDRDNKTARLISVDQSSILEKLAAFENIRNDALAKVEKMKEDCKIKPIPIQDRYQITTEDWDHVKSAFVEALDREEQWYQERWCAYNRVLYSMMSEGKIEPRAYYARLNLNWSRAYTRWKEEVKNKLEPSFLTKI